VVFAAQNSQGAKGKSSRVGVNEGVRGLQGARLGLLTAVARGMAPPKLPMTCGDVVVHELGKVFERGPCAWSTRCE
jgi:hypothetical protein